VHTFRLPLIVNARPEEAKPEEAKPEEAKPEETMSMRLEFWWQYWEGCQ